MKTEDIIAGLRKHNAWRRGSDEEPSPPKQIGIWIDEAVNMLEFYSKQGTKRVLSWDHRFLSLAGTIATWSKDPSTQCGAVIADKKNRLVSVGYNGFPQNTSDDPGLYADRSRKYPRVIHAEQNAMAFAQRDIEGCSMYVWPFMPCSQCAAMIVQRGISRVVTKRPTPELIERWGESNKEASQLFSEASVDLVYLD